MNVTLSLDEQLVERARDVAASRGMSLNQLIRHDLEQMTGNSEREQTFAALHELLVEQSGNSNGWAWNREEIQRAGLR